MNQDSPLEFPCDIPIKIFGLNDAQFRKAVLELMRRHYPELTESDLSERPSREDRYLSLTVTVTAESREQIDAVFSDLSAHEQVIMVL